LHNLEGFGGKKERRRGAEARSLMLLWEAPWQHGDRGDGSCVHVPSPVFSLILSCKVCEAGQNQKEKIS